MLCDMRQNTQAFRDNILYYVLNYKKAKSFILNVVHTYK